MKFSRTTWTFFAVVVFLLVTVILGWTYSQQVDQQQQLALRLTQAQKNLAGINFVDLVAKKAPLVQQADHYNSEINDTKNKLTSSKDSIDATDSILADAKICSANVTDISSPGLGNEDFSGLKCETLSFSIKADGDLYVLSNFISSLSQVFPTSVVKSVGIGPKDSNSQVSLDSQTSQGSREKIYTASISLVIYNYKGN